ncbi:hypothetical protein AB0M87_04790 [Streptomyces sp. NPDC051320]|uniref:hypothetical protein n=1 Tax=Streptomyces sp. NPDC051320 TaxID=3154644 RepID=UPI00341729F9
MSSYGRIGHVDPGHVQTPTPEQHLLGQIARGEVLAGPDAARRIAARHQAAYGNAVWGQAPADAPTAPGGLHKTTRPTSTPSAAGLCSPAVEAKAGEGHCSSPLIPPASDGSPTVHVMTDAELDAQIKAIGLVQVRGGQS